MSRELRRVAPDWKHPRRTDRDGYQPLYDRSYREAITEWIKNHQLWEQGKHPDQPNDCDTYAEWDGDAPNHKYYRPDWKVKPTWYQLYETVSEGTPTTPPLPTKKALKQWLLNNPDYWGNRWDEASIDAVLKHGFATSGIMTGGKMYQPHEQGAIEKGVKNEFIN